MQNLLKNVRTAGQLTLAGLLLIATSLMLVCSVLPGKSGAGQIPATQLETPYKVFSLNQAQQVTGTASESNLFQITIPAGFLQNNGIIRTTIAATNDSVSGQAHLYCAYLGGALNQLPASSGGTGLWTNSVTGVNESLIQRITFLRNTNGTLLTYGDKTTNSFAAFGTANTVQTVNTGSNIVFTITGINAFSTNTLGTDLIMVELIGGGGGAAGSGGIVNY